MTFGMATTASSNAPTVSGSVRLIVTNTIASKVSPTAAGETTAR